MAASYRRVFCRPDGLSAEQLSRWEKALAAAVSLQRQLGGASPYILQLLGELEPSEDGFCVRHEPAEPLGLRVFDVSEAGSTAAELLRTAASLLDALRAYHEFRKERPPVHGGVCPGILLVTADGIPKISDFGIAPAYAALGEEFYKNLAVRTPPQEASPQDRLTAIWEVLKANISDRDDRLAPFIDPDKYESGRYQAFEPSSDLLATGVLLHLMAERRHPYLYDDATAHLKVDVLEFMLPMSMPTRVRRPELVKADDQAVKEWCELVVQLADRSPEKRPAAARCVERLPKINLDDILRTRLDALARTLDGDGAVDWDGLRGTLRPVAESESHPADLREQAAALLDLCNAALMVDTDKWQESIELLQRALRSQKLSQGAMTRARGLQARVDQNRAAARELDEIRAGVEALAGAPLERDAQLARIAERLARLAPETLPAPMRDRLEAATQDIEARRQALTAELRELAAQASEWLARAAAAHDQHEWDSLRAILDAPPALLTREMESAAEQLRSALRAHQEEQEARRRLRQELERCLTQAGELLDRGQLLEAQELAARLGRPGVDEDLRQAGTALSARIEEAAARRQQKEAELLRERARIDQLLQDATALYEQEDGTGLQEARRLAQDIVAHDSATQAQRESADILLQHVQRKLDELASAAMGEIEALQRAEARLAETRALIASGQLLDAQPLTTELNQSKFPHIRDQVAGLIEELNARLESYRIELRGLLDQADQLFEQGDFEQSLKLANQVWENRASDEQLLARAHARMSEAETQAARLAEMRAQAERALNEGLALLTRADIPRARECFDRAATSGLLPSDERAQLDLVLLSLPSLETAWEMLETQDYPAALAAARPVQTDSTFAPVREAAACLTRKAREGQSASLLRGLEKHLEHRAALEEERADLEEVSPDDSLGVASPAWLRTCVGQFDTFVQSCSLAERPAREPQLAAGTRLGGKYEIAEFLGRGGMGEVYRAVDLKLKREVALKIAPPQAQSAELAAALQNEAEAIASLSHPHIVHINSFDVIDGRPCFDTNYIRGKDLGAFAGGQRLKAIQVVSTLIPVCDALAYAHGRGVLHRDIKPQNIYLGSQPGEGPWLIDFGLARMRSICEARELEGLCGTPGYVAPEVIRSLGREADPRSDVFALGCVLYVLLSGQPPFRSLSKKGRGLAGPSRTLLQTLRYQVDPLSQLSPDTPEALRLICQKAMAADPADRYQSAQELAQELRAFLQAVQEGKAREELKAARERFEQRRRETPQELEDLDAAAALAEKAAKRRVEPVHAEATTLLAEIGRVRQEITAAMADGRQQLETAGRELEARRHRPAFTALKAVVANPYVPDLHPRAAELATACEALRAQARTRRLGVVGVAVLVMLVGGSVVAWQMGVFGGSETKIVVSTPPQPREQPQPPSQEQPKPSPPSQEQPKPPAPPQEQPSPPKPPAPAPVLAIEPAVRRVSEGLGLSVEARGQNIPQGATYHWYRAAAGALAPLPEGLSARDAAFTVAGANSSQAGDYVCVVRLNNQELVQAKFTLQVTEPQYKIVLGETGRTINLNHQETRTIEARTQPETNVKLAWFKLGEGDAEQRFSDGPNLTIAAPEAGRFICRAGSVTSDIITIIRAAAPEQPKPPDTTNPPPTEPVTPPPVITITAFNCNGDAGFMWPTRDIECTVSLSAPSAFTAADIDAQGGAVDIQPTTPSAEYKVKISPQSGQEAAVNINLKDRLKRAPAIQPSLAYRFSPEPVISVDAGQTAQKGTDGRFTATRQPIELTFTAPPGLTIDPAKVSFQPASVQHTWGGSKLTLSDESTAKEVSIRIQKGAVTTKLARESDERVFTILLDRTAPTVKLTPPETPPPPALGDLTLEFSKPVTIGPGGVTASVNGGAAQPLAPKSPSADRKTYIFDGSKLTDKVTVQLDPAAIRDDFLNRLSPDRLRWEYQLTPPANAAWLQSRTDLERALQSATQLDLALLLKIGAAKGVSGGGLPASLTEWTATFTRRLIERGGSPAISAALYVEYVWGAQNVYALSWPMYRNQGIGKVELHTLGSSAVILDLIRKGPADSGTRAELGRLLVRPIAARLNDATVLGDIARSTPTSSLGIALAPDGPLCLVPLEQLRFDPVPLSAPLAVTHQKGSQNKSEKLSLSSLSSLQDLCPPQVNPAESLTWVSIWRFVSLAPGSVSARQSWATAIELVQGSPGQPLQEVRVPNMVNGQGIGLSTTPPALSTIRSWTSSANGLLRNAPDAGLVGPRFPADFAQGWLGIVSTPVSP